MTLNPSSPGKTWRSDQFMNGLDCRCRTGRRTAGRSFQPEKYTAAKPSDFGYRPDSTTFVDQKSPQQDSKRIAPWQLFAPHQPFPTAVFFMGFTPIPACSFCRDGCFAFPGPGPKAGGLRPEINRAERGRIGVSRLRNTEYEKTDEGRKLRLPCQVSERERDSCDPQNWPSSSGTRNRTSNIRYISFCEATYGRFSRLIYNINGWFLYYFFM